MLYLFNLSNYFWCAFCNFGLIEELQMSNIPYFSNTTTHTLPVQGESVLCPLCRSAWETRVQPKPNQTFNHPINQSQHLRNNAIKLHKQTLTIGQRFYYNIMFGI